MTQIDLRTWNQRMTIMKHVERSQVVLIAGSLIVGCLAYALHSGQHTTNLNHPASHNEVEHAGLKKEGYDSLQAAISAARYRIYADEKPGHAFYVNNSAQNLNAYFTASGSRVGSCGMRDEGPTPTPQLAVSFKRIGYGNALSSTTGVPEMIVEGNLIRFRHQLAAESQPVSHDIKSAIEEWFVNKPEGLEHGFTILEPVVERHDGER